MICSHISGKNNKNKPRLYSLWRDIMNECGFVIEYLDIIPVTIQIMAYTSLCLSVSDCRVNVLMKERKKKKKSDVRQRAPTNHTQSWKDRCASLSLHRY